MTNMMALLVGAVLSGIVQSAIRYADGRRERQAILRAIAAEVETLCAFVREQHLPERYRASAAAIASGEPAGIFWLDSRMSYVAVGDSLMSKLGRLRAHEAAAIARFYTNCKLGLDSGRSDGWLGRFAGKPGLPDALCYMAFLADRVLLYGDEVRRCLRPRWQRSIRDRATRLPL